MVYAPLLNEFFSTATGTGVTLNGTPVAARRVPVSEAMVYTHIGRSPEHLAESLSISAYLGSRVRRLRMIGSIALALAYVAAGRLDGVVQMGVSAWDFMAGVLLVEATGGFTADPAGGDVHTASRGVVAASTPALLNVLLESIANAQQGRS